IRRRNARGWNTADLARAADLFYSTVRNVEKGYSKKPAEWILDALIRALENDKGVMYSLAGYGEIPERTPYQVLVSLNSLVDDAPLWHAAIEEVKRMKPDEQRMALAVLRAQLDAAARHWKDRQ